jgi:hypothetical protein
MNKLRIFLSSRVKSAFTKLDKNYKLTDLRLNLRKTFEEEIFLGEHIFDIIINENNFRADFTKNSFDNCLSTMLSCNIIIILYNGEAGWSAKDVKTAGICHEEFNLAIEKFSGLTYALNLTHYFDVEQFKLDEKNKAFIKAFEDWNKSYEEIKVTTVKGLEETVVRQIKSFILDAMEKAFLTRKEEVFTDTEYGATLDWSKLTYHERQSKMIHRLEPAIQSVPAFRDILKKFHAIPDNMSVADARNLIGRPFVEEHEFIKKKIETSGVIHFVVVYGNATEIQVKNLVGYPDLVVIKGTFGYYLWEKNTHIQMFFLIACNNPQKIDRRLNQLINWLRESQEQPKIMVRAHARHLILSAINEAEKMKGLK